jgi:hypothetical protein
MPPLQNSELPTEHEILEDEIPATTKEADERAEPEQRQVEQEAGPGQKHAEPTVARYSIRYTPQTLTSSIDCKCLKKWPARWRFELPTVCLEVA